MAAPHPQRPFTTFEVAKICAVFHQTVINWANKGKLKAYLTPGGHRRILLQDLLEFMKRFDMPIPEDLAYRPKKVLVVEDDAALQRVLVRSLQKLRGIKIEACSGGLEAMISIGKEAPDLLVLDLRIPQVNGIEVCRLLKSNEQTVPIKIIAVTGEALSASDEKYLKQRVDGFFLKPLPLDPFNQKASQLLEL